MQILRTWGQRALCTNINNAARELLSLSTDRSDMAMHGSLDDVTSTEQAAVEAPTHHKKKKGRKGANMASMGRDEPMVPGNVELKALEAHMLRVSKQGLHSSIALH